MDMDMDTDTDMNRDMDTDTDTDTDAAHEPGHSGLLVMCSIFRILHREGDGWNERLSDCCEQQMCYCCCRQLPVASCHLPAANYQLPATS
ncbi:hypothetical protein AWZ03_010303 [Drosophila navojoa]|uniref:Uncharacterized protein n=1 Tax=Drosophila navojoa TaxID=7232 RepID=A0A484B314_DRONA|nr:hypothetical protein AWZ03_010303 [Drosophila navojoa]